MNNHPSAVSGVLKRPFAEQVAFYRNKLGKMVPTAKWDDLTGAMHDRAFMVAGAAKTDLLADLAVAVDKSISQGQSLGEFRKDFKGIVDKRGWHGWTGEGSKKGEAWRTRIIYTTNAQTSYNAGRYAQLQDFDYWVYKHNDAVRAPRVQHLAWDGLTLPKDHPFWQTHAPQNGFGCECYVLGARRPDAARRLGGNPDKPLPSDWNTIDPKTGTPKGVAKGWDYQPGQTVTDVVKAAAEKTVNWPYELAKAYMQSVPQPNKDLLSSGYRGLESTAKAAKAYAQKALAKETVPPYFTFGLLTAEQVAIITELVDGKSVDGFDFALDASAIGHINKQHGQSAKEESRGQRAVGTDDFASIPLALNEYSSIVEPDTPDDRVFKVIKESETERWNLLFEYRAKRRMLVLKTFYIQRKE